MLMKVRYLCVVMVTRVGIQEKNGAHCMSPKAALNKSIPEIKTLCDKGMSDL